MTLALVPTRLTTTALGLPSLAGSRLLDRPVLVHTLQRVARIEGVTRIVVVHPADETPFDLLAPYADAIAAPIDFHPDPAGLTDAATRKWAVARSVALTSWRGGLGQATCYDELLPAGPLADAAERGDAEAVLLVGGDWPLVDPALGSAVLANHRSAPDQLKLCFTQAPPGLAPVVVHRDVLRQLADHPGSGIGPLLGYNPQRPALDPISKDVNTPIPHAVRDCRRRFIHDSPRTAATTHRLARRLGEQLLDADASAIVAAVAEALADRADAAQLAHVGGADPAAELPQHVTLELTPERPASGPVTAGHHVTIDRPPISLDLARRLIDQLAPDTALRLGGLGDALLHPQWRAIVEHAAARCLSVAVETDLLVVADGGREGHPASRSGTTGLAAPPRLADGVPADPLSEATIEALLASPIDLLSVRLNADSAAVYREMMGVDGFAAVMDNLKRLHNRRAGRLDATPTWIVPRLAKTTANLRDMETFFERWLRLFGSAVIEPATCGCGLMPDASPVPMHPPARVPCRQLGGRLTLLSTGVVALCDQDWLARDPLGDAAVEPLADLAARAIDRQAAHRDRRYAELTLCGQCTQWHRP
jgi:hypothetical protein